MSTDILASRLGGVENAYFTLLFLSYPHAGQKSFINETDNKTFSVAKYRNAIYTDNQKRFVESNESLSRFAATRFAADSLSVGIQAIALGKAREGGI